MRETNHQKFLFWWQEVSNSKLCTRLSRLPLSVTVSRHEAVDRPSKFSQKARYEFKVNPVVTVVAAHLRG